MVKIDISTIDTRFADGIPVNPLDKKQPDPKDPEKIYDEKDKSYLSMLQVRLERSKMQKNQPYEEFNGQTYYQYYEENEKKANTYLEPKRNEDDVIVSTGTVEQKLDALLSNIANLNLTEEVFSFDKDNRSILGLGVALEDIIHDTKIQDGSDGAGDEEKKLLRQRELLKQGVVFVQEEWLRKFQTKKILNEKYSGEFKDFKGYSEKLELVFEGPSRTLLHGPNVYLGDITAFDMDDQPYVFVIVHMDYDVAKGRFGKFENWDNVVKGRVTESDIDNEGSKTIYDNKWRLTELKENQVELIFYQDPIRDEFQLIANGVLLLPIGFPLSAVSPGGKINIAKQIFRPINEKFAYGASFVASGSVKEVATVVDEMLKLFILKTRKSITPAYVNTSGRVINKKALSPGRISMGIEPGALQPIAGQETQGVTQGEFAIFKELQDIINKSTVSDQFTGNQGKSGTTATEVIELKNQARLSLGLAITSCALLEKKLGYLRLWNIIANWFDPTGSRVESINGVRELVKTFRSTNRQVNIEGEGSGERRVSVTDGEVPNEREIRDQEISESKERGVPIRKIIINSKGIKNAKILWYIEITQKERESSSFNKLMFREMLNDILTLIQFGSQPNIAFLEDEASRIWGKSKTKMFNQRQVTPDLGGVSTAGGQGRANQAGIPDVPVDAESVIA